VRCFGATGNSTDKWFWWGRSCGKLKGDFDEHSSSLKSTYEDAAEDGDFGYVESARIIIKVNRLVKTVEKATEKGCDWVEKHEANTAPIQELMEKTQSSIPCIAEARESFERAGKDATEADAFKALGMLFRSDCEPSEGESSIHNSEEVQQEEKVEEEAVDKRIEDLQVAEGMQSLLQKISTHSSAFVIVLPAIVGVILGFIYSVLTCLVALIIFTAVLGMVYCLIKMILGELMDESYDELGTCTEKWIDWMKSDHEIGGDSYNGVQIGAGVCLANQILWAFGGHGIAIHTGGVYYR